MADLITRLKVDSTEYDAKIKRAAQGLQHYVQSAHDSGDVIGRLLGDTKKYVESLGNMTTVSTTARGRLNELTAAFTDLRTVYNSLSDEEKNAQGGFGQTLNKQLEILKNRINDTKQELKDIDTELGNTKQAEQGTASGIEGLTSALGINMKSLAGWGSAIAAGKVALDVAKDAFFASESTVDEWGRTVAASQSLYEGFRQPSTTATSAGT
jgi:chromosome segregation ATPase